VKFPVLFFFLTTAKYEVPLSVSTWYFTPISSLNFYEAIDESFIFIIKSIYCFTAILKSSSLFSISISLLFSYGLILNLLS
jgi:hypothetical protein